jgi:uncharacterized protein (DUF342 family)
LPIKKAPEEQPSHGLAYSSTVRKDDGRLEVFVAPDSMSASADLYPPLGDGAPISADYAAELLARLGICCGVDWELLNERILEANTEGHIQRAVAIAKGIAPVDAVAEHIVPIASLLPGFVPVDDRELSVDWKNLKPYSIVKKDEPVAAIAPMKNGITGSDIYGKDISYATLNPTAYSLGKNLERRGDQIVALIDGRLCLDGAKLSVENVLMVKGDVDFRVGHIMFPGDVVIEGGVASGFKVYSGGSISIKETMDAFDVSAKKDLLCAQGIIGKEQGFVRVGGNLKAKFMENARCAVRGDVEIPGSIVGSSLYVLGRLSMGDKGRIVGGEVHATHGVLCGWIGGPTRPVTIINAGVDFTIQQKLDKASEELKEHSLKLARLEALLKQRPDASIQKLRDQAHEKMKSLGDNIADLAKRVDIDDGAIVEARGGVYPGCTITICHIRISIEEPLKKTRFRLDRNANKIIVEH